MGSTVVIWPGRAVVTATGMDTEMGKIAGVLAQTQQEQTPLQVKLSQLGKTSIVDHLASACSSFL